MIISIKKSGRAAPTALVDDALGDDVTGRDDA